MVFILAGDFLWITVLAAFIGIVIGETGFCLTTDRRPGRVAFLGSTLFSLSMIAVFIAYKIFYPPQPTPYVPVDRTNATVRAGSLKTPGLKYIAGCQKPSDTLLWIDIAKGTAQHDHPRTVEDFQAQYWDECGFYVVDKRDTVEGPAVTFGGVDMVCIKDFRNSNICNWIPKWAIELDP